jgi:SAM-dependent methyltransferase
MNCRFCHKEDIFKFLDLGSMPPANSFLTEAELSSVQEKAYPLDVFFCEQCGLVQIGYVVPPDELFKEYIYVSSTSDMIHKHADYLAKSFQKRFGLDTNSLVVEIASNDGTVLHYFKKLGVRILGIEPATNIAKVAADAGIETFNDFFNDETSPLIKARYGSADVLLGRHVFAHVPEIHGFVKGLKDLLAPHGVVAIEAPYIIDFIEKTEFDTVYHEHYSYLSVRSMSYLFNLYEMELFDVERVAIHGGSILYFAGHEGAHPVTGNVATLANEELSKGLGRKETYVEFSKRTAKIKNDLTVFLRSLTASGKRMAAYGAPAKGNTLLNYCGITTDLVAYTVDKSPHKQGLYTPGAHLFVHPPEKLLQDQPDYVLLLAWNFADEILEQQRAYRDAGGKFILPIPEVKIV